MEKSKKEKRNKQKYNLTLKKRTKKRNEKFTNKIAFIENSKEREIIMSKYTNNQNKRKSTKLTH